MTDNCKIISVTAKPPVVSVSDGAKVAKADTKEVITRVESVQLAPPSPDVCYESVLTGLGEEWIPDPRLFKYLENEFSLNEYFAKHFKKVLSDASSTSDIRFSRVTKILIDNTSHSDVFNRVWNAFRSYNDSVTRTEQVRLHPFKVVSDHTTNFEQLTYFVRKNLVDAIHMADLTKIYIQVSSGKFETVHNSDVFSRVVNYVRQFSDLVHTTDDFYGAANIDDDEYAWVYKVILDFAETHETFGVKFTKSPILDVADASDISQLHFRKPEQDTANADDVGAVFSNSLVKLENVTNTERVSSVFNKAPIEENINSIDYVYNHLIKPFEDAISNVDVQFAEFTKVNEDIVDTLELIRFDLSTTVSEQTNVSEEFAKVMSKMTETDSSTLSETLFKKDIALLIKEEDYFLSDYFFEDYFFKAVHTADRITDVQFTKNIVDIVDATDDFYGALNVDDDQTAFVNKVLVDWASIGDTFSRVVQFYRSISDSLTNSEVISKVLSKILSDSGHVSETIAKSVSKTFVDINIFVDYTMKLFNKGLQDVTSNSELMVFTITKALLDTAHYTETVSKDTSKKLTDVSVVSELFSRVFVAIRSYLDSYTVSDSSLITVGKNNIEYLSVSEFYNFNTSKTLIETVNRSEVKYFSFSKQLSDLVDATDDFYGVSNVDDDQTAAVTKVLADYGTFTDILSRTVQYIRSYSDGVTKSDVTSISLSKPITETVSKSDLLTKVGAKVITDQTSTSQSLTIYNQNYYASDYMVPGYFGEMYTY